MGEDESSKEIQDERNEENNDQKNEENTNEDITDNKDEIDIPKRTQPNLISSEIKDIITKQIQESMLNDIIPGGIPSADVITNITNQVISSSQLPQVDVQKVEPVRVRPRFSDASESESRGSPRRTLSPLLNVSFDTPNKKKKTATVVEDGD